MLRTSAALAREATPPKPALAGADDDPFVSGHRFDLVHALRFLRRRVRLIAAFVAAGLALTAAALVVLPARYTATAVVLVDPREQRVGPSQEVLPGIGSDAAALESQVEVVESTPLAKAVIKKLGLASDPEFNRRSSLLSFAGGRIESGPDEQEAEATRIVERFRDNLRVTRRGLTYVLEIAFSSSDPRKAAEIANALAQAYIADQIAAQFGATQQASAWLSARLVEMRGKVHDAEEAVARFKLDNGIVDVGASATLPQQQVSELSQQLLAAQSRTAEAKAKYLEAMRGAKVVASGGAIPAALQSPVVANLREQLATATGTAAQMTATYGERHPALANIRAQILDLRRNLEAELARIQASLSGDYAVAQAHEAALAESLAKVKQQVGNLQQVTVRLNELEREAQASRALFEQFLARFKETSQQQSLQRSNARIISPATVPLRPSRPGTGLILAMAALASFALGIGVAVALENAEEGFRTGAELEASSVGFLGLLPTIEPARQNRPERPKPSRRRRASPAPAEEAAAAAQLAAGDPGRMDFAVRQPHSLFANTLRGVAGALASSEGTAVQVVLVSSARPGEGKTVATFNLANLLARSGTRTLLVDANVLHSSVTEAAGMKGSPGLIDVLNSKASLERAIGERRDGVLDILPIGHFGDPIEASQALIGPRLKFALRRCRELYDVTLIDGPAMLAASYARQLLAHADGALLVVEWRRTHRADVMAALAGLAPLEGKVLGAMLSKVDLRAYRAHDPGFREPSA